MTDKRDGSGRFAKGNKGGPGRPNRADELGDAQFIAFMGQAEPPTELEARERFRILNDVFGLFEVVLSQEAFPDYVLRTKSGKVIRVEAELKSLHFKVHKHDIESCDLIICWEHNWKDCPIPVLPIAHLWFAYKEMNKIGAFAEIEFFKDLALAI
jgi:hypothetical protein